MSDNELECFFYGGPVWIDDQPKFPIVWCTELRKFAYLVEVGAHFSTIKYTEEGIGYEEQIENDEYEYWSDHAIGYESD